MSTLLHPDLRSRVLMLLPIATPRLHLFRRRLACAFVHEDGACMAKAFAELVQLGQLAQMLELQTPYQIRQTTDYDSLRALLATLDIVIDSGATSGSVNDRDNDVDRLIRILQAMSSKIIDTNAQNIARTETKDAIERLQFRLSYQVRSKIRIAIDGFWDQSKLGFAPVVKKEGAKENEEPEAEADEMDVE